MKEYSKETMAIFSTFERRGAIKRSSLITMARINALHSPSSSSSSAPFVARPTSLNPLNQIETALFDRVGDHGGWRRGR